MAIRKIRDAPLKGRWILFFENLECGNEKRLARRRRCLKLLFQTLRLVLGNHLPVDKFAKESHLRRDCRRRNRIDHFGFGHFLRDLGGQVWRRGHKRLHLERKRLGLWVVALLKPRQNSLKRRGVALFYQYLSE